MNETLGDLMDAAIAAHLENTHTAIPGTVTSVRSGGGVVGVQPSLSRLLRDGRTERLPVVPNVPVWFPRGGGAAVTWPVAVGDSCLLVFSERSLDEWKTSGGTVTPDDPRRHGLADAIAFVGLSAGGTGSDVIRATMGDSTVDVGPDATTVTVGGTELTVDGSGVTISVGGVTLEVTSGGLAVTGGSVTHDGVNIGNTHTHGGVTPGGGSTGGPG